MILLLFILGIALPVQAQMPDLMGVMAIDGAMTAQAAKGYATANTMLKKNRLAQELQMKSVDIQTHMLGGRKNVSRETFSILNYPGYAENQPGEGLSLTLKNVEGAVCEGLDQHFAGAKKIQINKNNKCSDKNIIKFYY